MPAPRQALRFLLAPPGGASDPAAYELPGEAALEERVGLALVHALQQELASRGTSLEEDVAALGGAGRGGKGPQVDAAVLAFRIEKKRVLAECLAQLTGGG